LASIFELGISAWFIMKGRHKLMAKRSIIVAAVFGLITSLFLVMTGDGSAYHVTQKQPMKLAAMEGLYEGQESAGLVAVGMLTPGKEYDDDTDPYVFKIEIPKLLSLLGYRDANAFVPGVKDLVEGYEYTNKDGKVFKDISVEEKIKKGKTAIGALADFRNAQEAGDDAAAETYRATLEENFKYFGYGYLNDPKSVIPNVPLTFYSFHIMVALGFLFILIFVMSIFFVYKDSLEKRKWFLWVMLLSIPLAYIASQAGWIVAELGRQPWVIQDVLPTVAAVSQIDASSVQITFWLFAVIFTGLAIAEIKILLRQIKIGPKDLEGGK
ncbi:MAG: cytochrome ubiquinol oxidase subunit I, partial [Salinivirgaceae bacterium]